MDVPSLTLDRSMYVCVVFLLFHLHHHNLLLFLLLLLLPPSPHPPPSLSLPLFLSLCVCVSYFCKHVKHKKVACNVLVHVQALMPVTLRLSNEERKHNSVLLVVAGTGIVVAAQVLCLLYIQPART